MIALVQHAFRADKRAKGRKVAESLGGYADYLRTHPELLQLEALRYSILERNLAPGCSVRSSGISPPLWSKRAKPSRPPWPCHRTKEFGC